jgi:SSS family solute:Na+ symporter
MFILTILFMVVSLLPLEKVSWLFRGLLILNFLALLYGLCMLHGLPDYLRSPLEFPKSLEQVSFPTKAGITLSTILLVILDMRYQQFVVQAKDIQSLYKACVLAAISLLLLAFLPSSIVIASLKAGILPPSIDGKEILPFILAWIGGGTDKPLGILLIVSLLVPAIGVGSSILRVQSKTILDFNILPVFKYNQLLVVLVNALLSLVVALRGGTIITLIVFFYAAYVGSVFIPFVAYLITQIQGYTFSKTSVRLSLIVGSVSAMSALILTLINPKLSFFASAELNILGIGILFAFFSLLATQLIEKYFLAPSTQEEI